MEKIEVTKILDQCKLEAETPGSRNFGLSIWATVKLQIFVHDQFS